MPFDVVDKVADPDTWGRPPNQTQMGFIELLKIHDGRIWTDKTVRTSGGFGGFPAATQPDEFVVTFSALSQISPQMEGYQIPTDTVFIIDVSGSMRQMRDAGDNRMRIDVLIEALNEAVAILQSAHPQNRIAVVAYGGGDPGTGHARVERLLPLGRYLPPAFGSGPAPGFGVNEFFSYIPNPSASIPAGAAFSQYHHLRVNNLTGAPVEGVTTANVAQRTILVNGSTPTQWGIYEGANILEGATTTATVDKTVSPGVTTPTTVTRRPNIVLMTDGEPTIGWTNYLFDTDPANAVTPPGAAVALHSPTPGVVIPPATGTPANDVLPSNAIYFGDGSYGEMGVSIMTVLTAAHRKREVLNSYFPAGWAIGQEPSQPAPSVGFYTIAFGSQPTQATKDLIRATLDPFGNDFVASGVHADAVNADIRRRNTGDKESLTGDPNYGTIFKQNPWSDPAIGPSGSNSPRYYNPNMGVLLNSFLTSPITFHAARRQASIPAAGSFVWDDARVSLANTATPTLTSDELNYATMFREASNLEDIRKVFQEITTSIQELGVNYTVTDTHDEDSNFGGYLVFSDVLGEYMQVRNVGGIEFNNTLFSRDGFAAAIASPGSARNEYIDILYEHMNYGTPDTDPLYLSKTAVAEIVAANAASTDFIARNSLKYYANTNRDFVGNFYNSDGTPAAIPANAAAIVEVFPMWGTMNVGDAPPPDNIRDLRLITFHVITALRDGGFDEIFAEGIAPPNKPMTRTLKAGEQMVRWYVPAGLIPLRIPQFDAGGFSGFGGNTHPIRVSYTVGLDRERVRAGVSDEYANKNRVPGTTDRYYFYANRHYLARPDIDNSNLTLASFQPDINNPFYLLDQQRGAVKTSNPTETAQHVVVNRTLAYQSSENLDMDWLGNNGRLTLLFSEPPPPAPQTGDSRTLLLPIAAVAFGVLFLAGAEIYRRKYINKANE